MPWSAPGVLLGERVVLVLMGVACVVAVVVWCFNFITGSEHGKAQRQYRRGYWWD